MKTLHFAMSIILAFGVIFSAGCNQPEVAVEKNTSTDIATICKRTTAANPNRLILCAQYNRKGTVVRLNSADAGRHTCETTPCVKTQADKFCQSYGYAESTYHRSTGPRRGTHTVSDLYCRNY